MPVIAVAPCRSMADYVESIRRAGGDPQALTHDGPPAAALAGVHGVLLTGGGDIDPSLYGEAAHSSFTAAEPGRDTYEIALVKAAVAAGLPLFAICRGAQVLNVALGGSLVQDVPSQVDGAVVHAVAQPSFAIAHDVWIARGSRLWTLMQELLEDGETCPVNSRHHQAIGRVAPGLEVSATAPDGVIEAVERPGEPFCLGVQWHPENFWRTGEFRPLFEGFVAAARARE
jgi:putative glutamine amidotransferase